MSKKSKKARQQKKAAKVQAAAQSQASTAVALGVRLPVATKEGGDCVAPVQPGTVVIPGPPGGSPAPFPSQASMSGASGCTSNVLVQNKPIFVEDSEIPHSSGDEPSVGQAPTKQGAVSTTNLGKVTATNHSRKVKAEGKGVVLHLAPTQQNGNNTVGSHVSPSQTKVEAAL